MAIEMLMPKLGEAMESGTIMKWLKQEGDLVKSGEPIVEVMTDKINVELEAEASGVLLKICKGENEEVPVLETIAYIGNADEQIPDPDNVEPEPALELSTPAAKIRKTPAAKRLAAIHHIDLREVTGSGPNGRIQRIDVEKLVAEQADRHVKATPLARKVAEAVQADLSQIEGTGAHGKIVRDDVMKHSSSFTVESTPAAIEQKVKIEGIRKVIAERMVKSASEIPHVTLTTEADMTRVIELRNQLLPIIERQTGYRLSYTEIMMKFTAMALRKHPMINASLQGDYIVLNPHVNVGLAVSVPNGLLVPVVADADQKSLAALTEECKQVGALAREGKLTPDRMKGGTFTISNLGMYAVDAFTPVINQPESAILGIGRINEKAVGVDGMVVLRPMMTLSLSFDHRVIDGAPAAAFLTECKQFLENPYLTMV